MKKAAKVISAAGLVLGVLAAAIITTEAGDHHVHKMYYYNNGSYIVKWVEVIWEKDGKKNSRKYNNEITEYNSFCFSADAWNADHSGNDSEQIPEGAEMHLKFDIVTGDEVNCKKEDAHFYFKPGGGEADFRSSGTTHNNNHCKISGKNPGNVVSGNCR